MVEINRILFCHDFSDTADFVFDYALSMAEKFSASLYVVHVIEEGPQWAYVEPLLGVDTARTISEEMEQKIEQKLNDICKSKAGMVNECYPIMTRGIPFSEIITIAKEKEIDLIVMGTHGRTGLGRVLFGSVALRVLRRATCPVLTVRMPAKEFKGS
ncbi:MAG: universal stress protein [Pseudomonadota bacterium]